MSNVTEGVDYAFVVPEEQDGVIDIELLTGEYAGVVYRYGSVSVNESEEEQDQATLSFEFHVINSNGFESLTEDADFMNHIGEILTGIIVKQLEHTKSNPIVE